MLKPSPKAAVVSSLRDWPRKAGRAPSDLRIASSTRASSVSRRADRYVGSESREAPARWAASATRRAAAASSRACRSAKVSMRGSFTWRAASASAAAWASCSASRRASLARRAFRAAFDSGLALGAGRVDAIRFGAPRGLGFSTSSYALGPSPWALPPTPAPGGCTGDLPPWPRALAAAAAALFFFPSGPGDESPLGAPPAPPSWALASRRVEASRSSAGVGARPAAASGGLASSLG
mmetsp:Transcript_37501/g.83873  ORF Transcript_37501/g.83873 Transcript_37501/m.83873 type:complete len:237 (-) Transcript_37501:1478-2188(-)